MAHRVGGERRGNAVDVGDLIEATVELLGLGDLLLALLDHRQGVLDRGERLQIAGAVIDRYTLGGSWTRRSQDNRTDRCESAFTHSSSFPARWRPTLPVKDRQPVFRSEEHTSELQSLMRISYAVFCLKNKKQNHTE